MIPELRAGECLDQNTFAHLRRDLLLRGCKWDPQVGDVQTLAPFPLIMQLSQWRQLAAVAETLTAEAFAAEKEILSNTALLSLLGLPRALRKALSGPEALTPGAARVMRFDFHPTTQGWRISEVNSDVPGGFSEASHFTNLFAQKFPNCVSAGDPAEALCHVLAQNSSDVIGLLSAPGYMEDHQVVAFLANRLHELGRRVIWSKPEQITWLHRHAHFKSIKLDAIIRFYQAEWISKLDPATGWKNFFGGGHTPITNPPQAVITESKRFPLLWPYLNCQLTTWKKYLPETREPNCARDHSWLLKTAMSNNGDSVRSRDWMSPRDWFWTKISARFQRRQWLAQRRFESAPVDTPFGPRHLCLGVYTINGTSCGAYARLSPKPLIDYSATDAAILIEHDD